MEPSQGLSENVAPASTHYDSNSNVVFVHVWREVAYLFPTAIVLWLARQLLESPILKIVRFTLRGVFDIIWRTAVVTLFNVFSWIGIPLIPLGVMVTRPITIRKGLHRLKIARFLAAEVERGQRSSLHISFRFNVVERLGASISY